MTPSVSASGASGTTDKTLCGLCGARRSDGKHRVLLYGVQESIRRRTVERRTANTVRYYDSRDRDTDRHVLSPRYTPVRNKPTDNEDFLGSVYPSWCRRVRVTVGRWSEPSERPH